MARQGASGLGMTSGPGSTGLSGPTAIAPHATAQDSFTLQAAAGMSTLLTLQLLLQSWRLPNVTGRSSLVQHSPFNKGTKGPNESCLAWMMYGASHMSLAAGSDPELKQRPCWERFLDSTASTAYPCLQVHTRGSLAACSGVQQRLQQHAQQPGAAAQAASMAFAAPRIVTCSSPLPHKQARPRTGPNVRERLLGMRHLLGQTQALGATLLQSWRR